MSSVHGFLVDDTLPQSFMLSGLEPGHLREVELASRLGGENLGEEAAWWLSP